MRGEVQLSCMREENVEFALPCTREGWFDVQYIQGACPILQLIERSMKDRTYRLSSPRSNVSDHDVKYTRPPSARASEALPPHRRQGAQRRLMIYHEYVACGADGELVSTNAQIWVYERNAQFTRH